MAQHGSIVKAVEARRPKTRYVADPGVRVLLVLSRLPIRLRDRVVTGVLGLRKAEAA